MSGRKILLVEPGYRNKYPPLGLMKLATYHKLLGDEPTFVKGCSHEAASAFWDRVYVTTMFSFDWDLTIRTIRFYQESLFGMANKIFVGGIAASILPDEMYKATGIYPFVGALNDPGVLDKGDPTVIDTLPPDYSILAQVKHQYACTDSYIGYATRGCIRKCDFCAVPTLEPRYNGYRDLKPWVAAIKEASGEKPHLLLMDNNVLASPRLKDIVADIRSLGFTPGARLAGRARYVDFNQGLDARLLTERKMELLAQIPINPFRLAYDDRRYADTYEKAVRIAAASGVRNFSTYVLYNFEDSPEDFWDRLHHNVVLGDELDIRISSFPMKYIPITQKDRRHVAPAWNRRFLRSIQCISLVTRGVISARHDFFHKAFGRDHREFIEILSMPEPYIIQRKTHNDNGAEEWRRGYRQLSAAQKYELLSAVSTTMRSDIAATTAKQRPGRVRTLLEHYVRGATP